ncbi:hypothetical protein KUL156_27800 [Alteromonas sp. KUL156]|nr:hypothetical protein KUL156_27800 [Alteromonas sp. KUL156]
MFRPFSSNNESIRAYCSLFSEQPHKHKLAAWQFNSPQQSLTDIKPLFYIESRTGRCIAFNGLIPVLTWQNNEYQTAFWSCDFKVAKDYRGKGLGSKIKRKLKEVTDGHSVMSMGISDTAYHVLQQQGWKEDDCSKFEHFIKHRKRGDSSFKKKLKLLVQESIKRLNQNQIKPVAPEGNFKISGVLPSAVLVDRLWEEVKYGYDKIVAKNHAYLHWKYECHPTAGAHYKYLTVYSHTKLISLYVYRHVNDQIKIVEYLGPKTALTTKAACFNFLLGEYSYCDLTISTNDNEFKTVASALGFLKIGSPQRFVAYNSKDDSAPEGWYLMSGDSDGELLEAAKTPNFSTKWLTDCEFENFRMHWNELLKRSDANPLFMSWEWQFGWWTTWRKPFNLSLKTLLVYKDQELVAIFPMYLDHISSFRKLPGKRLHFIGNRALTSGSVRTEYVSPIIAFPLISDAVDIAVNRLVNESIWSELVLADLCTQRSSAAFLFKKRLSKFVKFETIQKSKGYCINTSTKLSEYKNSLSANTRSAYFNKWKKISAKCQVGKISISNSQQFFELLNNFHIERWGQKVFDGLSLDFHQMLITLSKQQSNLSVELSTITENDSVISCSYNIGVEGTLYNIQSGFVEQHPSKVSLGKLHLGKVVEYSLKESSINHLDLLAGEGKNTNYKSSLNGNRVGFETIVFYRGSISQIYFLKKIYQFVQRKIPRNK